MKFDLSLIKAVTTGASQIFEDNGFHFNRFTKEQIDTYIDYDMELYERARCSAGIMLKFKTNSKKLFLSADIYNTGTMNFFAFDICVNDKITGTLGDVAEQRKSNAFNGKAFWGNFSGEYDLGDGEKEVKIYLPFAVRTVIKQLSVDDGAVVEPIKEKKSVIFYGDSITHGYDAFSPSNSYAHRTARYLKANITNRGIGGDTYYPPLAKVGDGFKPDYVFVAYGANDWNQKTKEQFTSDCDNFIKNIRGIYPDAELFAISPIWREIWEEERPSSYDFIRKFIIETAEKYGGHGISGFNLVPHDGKYFFENEGFLHPTDEGFEHYFNNLKAELDKYIK